jgi:non-ribosomal peptide synthase protein (TIGR01720 family)
VPAGGGAGFALLHPLTIDDRLVGADISFNYLGQFDQVLAPDAPLTLAPESPGPAEAAPHRRPVLLEITAVIGGGQLTWQWTYSRHYHRPDTITRLAHAAQAALEALIEQAPMASSNPPLLDRPSLIDIPAEQLGKALSKLRGRSARAEHIHDLTT